MLNKPSAEMVRRLEVCVLHCDAVISTYHVFDEVEEGTHEGNLQSQEQNPAGTSSSARCGHSQELINAFFKECF